MVFSSLDYLMDDIHIIFEKYCFIIYAALDIKDLNH